jgi:hypothetical protein
MLVAVCRYQAPDSAAGVKGKFSALFLQAFRHKMMHSKIDKFLTVAGL